MPPRVTIDQLPEQATPEDTNYLPLQDSGVTKKISIATLKTLSSTQLDTHLTDTSDAHDATAISATPAGAGVDGPDVQAQLGQLAGLVDATNDAIDAINATLASLSSTYVDVAGDTMTGPLTIAPATADVSLTVQQPVSGDLRFMIDETEPAMWFRGNTYLEDGSIELGRDGAVWLLGDTTVVTGHKLTLAADPAAALEAATKQYVDVTAVAKAGDVMTGPLTLAADPVEVLEPATKQYVDSSVAGRLTTASGDLRYVNTTGDDMSGILKMRNAGVEVYDLANDLVFKVDVDGTASTTVPPALGGHLTNKDYVDGLTASEPGYVTFPGNNNNYLSTPDVPEYHLTDDLTIVARVALTDWTPAIRETIAARWPGSGQNTYWFEINTNGAPRIFYSTDGSDAIGMLCSAPVSVADGTPAWVAVTVDVDNGAGSRAGRFWTSPDGQSWTQLGATVTVAGTTPTFNGSGNLTIGRTMSGTFPLAGSIHHLSIRNGIGAGGTVGGTEVFRFDGTELHDAAATSFVAASGHPVNVLRSGSPSTAIVPCDFPNEEMVRGATSQIGQLAPSPNKLRSGMYYGAPFLSIASFTPGEGVLHVNPYLMTAGASIDRIACNILNAGTTGALVRLGIYRFNEDSSSTLLVDCGAVAATATGVIEQTVAIPAQTKPWWVLLALTTQGGATTRPGYAGGPMVSFLATPTNSAVLNALGTSTPSSFLVSNATGALPATVLSPSLNVASSAPRLVMRVQQA